MSPLLEIWDFGFNPIILGLSLFAEWWVIWFVLGRDFTTTTKFVVIANLASAWLIWMLANSGAIEIVSKATGPSLEHGEISSGFVAWLVAILFACYLSAGTEALVLRWLVRKRRRSWRWDNYDLTIICAVNSLVPIFAAIRHLFHYPQF